MAEVSLVCCHLVDKHTLGEKINVDLELQLGREKTQHSNAIYVQLHGKPKLAELPKGDNQPGFDRTLEMKQSPRCRRRTEV